MLYDCHKNGIHQSSEGDGTLIDLWIEDAGEFLASYECGLIDIILDDAAESDVCREILTECWGAILKKTEKFDDCHTHQISVPELSGECQKFLDHYVDFDAADFS